jgi:hypothetical protein
MDVARSDGWLLARASRLLLWPGPVGWRRWWCRSANTGTVTQSHSPAQCTRQAGSTGHHWEGSHGSPDSESPHYQDSARPGPARPTLTPAARTRPRPTRRSARLVIGPGGVLTFPTEKDRIVSAGIKRTLYAPSLIRRAGPTQFPLVGSSPQTPSPSPITPPDCSGPARRLCVDSDDSRTTRLT